MYVVYSLEDQRDSAIFYIGVTTDVYKRFLQHLKCDGDNVAKNERIHSLMAEGYLPFMRSLEQLHNKHLAYERERYWMHHYNHLRMPLLNIVGPPKSLLARLEAPITKSSMRELVRSCILEGCSQNDIIKQVWHVSHGGRAYQKACLDLNSVLVSLMPSGDLDGELAVVREMLSQQKSQNEIVAKVFPSMRNADAIAEYRKLLATLVEREAL